MNGLTGRTLHVLVGPTAVGKSAVAQQIATETGAVVLSADSMLVYRGMDIGTAKPAACERGGVPYLGLDLVDPWEAFNVWRYREAVLVALSQLPREQNVIVAGGSGLYVRALLNGLDKAVSSGSRGRWEALFSEQGVSGLQSALLARDKNGLTGLSDPLNPRRLIRALERTEEDAPACRPDNENLGKIAPVAGLWVEPVELNVRIEQRVQLMYERGLVEEVRALIEDTRGLSDTAKQAIGYAEAIAFLEGRCSRDEAIFRTVVRTRQLAKRQRTWFRHQARVEWVETREDESVISLSRRVQNIWSVYGVSKLVE